MDRLTPVYVLKAAVKASPHKIVAVSPDLYWAAIAAIPEPHRSGRQRADMHVHRKKGLVAWGKRVVIEDPAWKVDKWIA